MKDNRLTIRIPVRKSELKEKLIKSAEKKQLSLNAYVVQILNDYENS